MLRRQPGPEIARVQRARFASCSLSIKGRGQIPQPELVRYYYYMYLSTLSTSIATSIYIYPGFHTLSKAHVCVCF